MYILVKKTDVSNEEILNMYHETMPDGRLILPISDLRMLGSIPNCQIVASAKELKELIKINAEEVANNKVDGVQGYNSTSINVAYMGGIDANGKAVDNRTDAQKASLVKLLKELRGRYPNAQILGHRDISPDTNHNGKVDSWERIKECPCFDAIIEYKNI